MVQDGGSVSFTYAWGGESCLKASVQRGMFAKETGETRYTDETEKIKKKKQKKQMKQKKKK